MKSKRSAVTESRFRDLYPLRLHDITSLHKLASLVPLVLLALSSHPSMPPIRRFDSDTTHISDSEPERESAREAARLVRARKTRTSRTCTSSSRRRPSTPFSDSSNTQQISEPAAIEPYFGLEARLSNLESEVAQLRVALKGVSWAHFHRCLLIVYSSHSNTRSDSAESSTWALFGG